MWYYLLSFLKICNFQLLFDIFQFHPISVSITDFWSSFFGDFRFAIHYYFLGNFFDFLPQNFARILGCPNSVVCPPPVECLNWVNLYDISQYIDLPYCVLMHENAASSWRFEEKSHLTQFATYNKPKTSLKHYRYYCLRVSISEYHITTLISTLSVIYSGFELTI